MPNLQRLIPALLIFTLVGTAHAKNETGQPNIVFVLFDDIGFGQPPSYRAASEFKMRNFDRLTREGMRFVDAHSAAANCTPTRYGVLTGRYPSRIGQFGVLTTYSPPIIPKTRLTVASFLQQHGYHTACVGKWHLGLNWVDGKPGAQDSVPVGSRYTDGPNAIGFNYFYGFTHARNIGTILEQDSVVANVEAIENQPLMIDKAIDYLQERSKESSPFFLYFPMCPPHNPIVPAPEFIGQSGVMGKEARYGDWIYQGDHMLGRILQTLDRTGQSENTLFIATGDNGAAKRPYPPYRASKSSIYEGGHREPFVVRWPGHVAPGAVSNQTICLNDFFATCSELLGTELPANAAEDSVSLLPIFNGTAEAPVREATIHQSPKGLAIRRGSWKLVLHKNGQTELFNLESDPGETTDILRDNMEITQQMTTLMQSYIDRGRSTEGPKQNNDYPLSLAFENEREE